MSMGGTGGMDMDADFKACLDRNWVKLTDSDDEEEEEEEETEDEDAFDEPKLLRNVTVESKETAAAQEGPDRVVEGSELIAESGLHFDQDGDPEWFFLQARSGMEDRVRASVEGMVRSLPNISRKVTDVLVPTTSVMKLNSSGKTVHKEDRMFPGYLLIYMVMDFPTWREINNVPYVHGFVGDTNQRDFKGSFQKPPAVPNDVVKMIFQKQSEFSDRGVALGSKFLPGQRVSITSGPYAGNQGSVVKVVPEQGMATVKIFVHNRLTEDEIMFTQMEIVEKSAEDSDDELDEILGQVQSQTNVNLKKLRRRNRDFKKGDIIVVKNGPYGGCTGRVKTTLPRQGKVNVALKMFSRTLEIKLPYEQVRLEDEDDDGNELLEDKSEGFVAAEQDNEEDSEESGLLSGSPESESDGALETLLKDYSTSDGKSDDDLSDEEFFRRIDDSITVKKSVRAQRGKTQKKGERIEPKSWFETEPEDQSASLSKELARQDEEAMVDLPGDHSGFVEDEIIEEEEEADDNDFAWAAESKAESKESPDDFDFGDVAASLAGLVDDEDDEFDTDESFINELDDEVEDEAVGAKNDDEDEPMSSISKRGLSGLDDGDTELDDNIDFDAVFDQIFGDSAGKQSSTSAGKGKEEAIEEDDELDEDFVNELINDLEDELEQTSASEGDLVDHLKGLEMNPENDGEVDTFFSDRDSRSSRKGNKSGKKSAKKSTQSLPATNALEESVDLSWLVHDDEEYDDPLKKTEKVSKKNVEDDFI